MKETNVDPNPSPDAREDFDGFSYKKGSEEEINYSDDNFDARDSDVRRYSNMSDLQYKQSFRMSNARSSKSNSPNASSKGGKVITNNLVIKPKTIYTKN